MSSGTIGNLVAGDINPSVLSAYLSAAGLSLERQAMSGMSNLCR